MSKFKLSKRSKDRREGVDQRLIEIDDLAIQLTTVDYGHPEDSGLRTCERQYEIFVAGNSMCDGVKRKSKHQSGKALDFYAFVNGSASWKHSHLAMVAVAYLQAASMLGYKLSYGGLWVRDDAIEIDGIKYGWDMAHVQLEE
jgi:peptidoglycan L-alanyl-D-glutamate endopeptidase CwlK